MIPYALGSVVRLNVPVLQQTYIEKTSLYENSITKFVRTQV